MEFIPILISAIAAAVVMPLFQWIKKASAWVDGLPSWLKQVLVVGLAAVSAFVTKLTGVPLPSDVFGMDATALQTVVTSLLAFLLHKIYKTQTA